MGPGDRGQGRVQRQSRARQGGGQKQGREMVPTEQWIEVPGRGWDQCGGWAGAGAGAGAGAAEYGACLATVQLD